MPQLINQKDKEELVKAIIETSEKLANIKISNKEITLIKTLPNIKNNIKEKIEDAMNNGNEECYLTTSDDTIPPRNFLEELLMKGYDIIWSKFSKEQYPKGYWIKVAWNKTANGTTYNEKDAFDCGRTLSSLDELYTEEIQLIDIRNIDGKKLKEKAMHGRDIDGDIDDIDDITEGTSIKANNDKKMIEMMGTIADLTKNNPDIKLFGTNLLDTDGILNPLIDMLIDKTDKENDNK